jgi:hypothetical protein
MPSTAETIGTPFSAARLRLRARATHRWIAGALSVGCAASVRVHFSRQINL